MAAFRQQLGLAPRRWRIAHMVLAVVIVACSAVHGLLIEGTMETMSKAALCVLVVAVAAKVIADRMWRKRTASRGNDATGAR